MIKDVEQLLSKAITDNPDEWLVYNFLDRDGIDWDTSEKKLRQLIKHILNAD